jgi:hypothetical protein
MPKYSVQYFTESAWVVIVEADCYEDALQNWFDTAYWDREPECISEDMSDRDVYIEEME